MQSSVDIVINALTVAAGISILIERVLEALKRVLGYESTLSRQHKDDAQSKKSLEAAKEALEKMRSALGDYGTSKDESKLLIRGPSASKVVPVQTEKTVDDEDQPEEDFERYSPVVIVPIEPKKLNEVQIKVFLVLLASGLGITMAELLNLRLLSMFLADSQIPGVLDTLFSGIVIGGGSHPVHALIRFLTTRKVPELEPTKQVKIQSQMEAPRQMEEEPELQEGSEYKWFPIVYQGGVKPASLENRNFRPADPTFVVYHHTAMSSNLPFQAIVDEFLVTKKWSTGYHCVIMPDGAIKPFCRWDRRGNHAKGLNSQSLGVSFHGNFHTANDDAFSNHDGRFGNQEPTQVQLDAGARLVTLWAALYPEIELDFEKDIVPHKLAIPGHTVCPGSNFPYLEFEKLIGYYHEAWQKSESAQKQIKAFKKKPFIYV